MKISIESLESVKDAAAKSAQSLRGNEHYYSDIRVEVSEGKGASALNGNVKGAAEDYGIRAGVRVYAKKNGIIAAGHAGKSIGDREFANISRTLEEMLAVAGKRAKINAVQKASMKKRAGFFGKMIAASELADEPVHVDAWKAGFKKSPLDLSLEESVRRTEKISSDVSKIKGIVSNSIGISTGMFRKVFASSEGSLIDQTWPITEAFVYVAAKGKGIETFYEWIGNWKGLELLEGENSFGKSAEEFAGYLAEGTVEVSNAPVMKTTEKPVTVITDPWFNELLSHEVTGHPSEADRALKKEGAWAGRAWWFNSIEDNMFGKRVGSENFTVFSDPSLDGYGRYKYDDEGVLAKKVVHIDKGILNEFLNSRETAHILGKKPNGGMRAMSAEDVPLIRMNNTAIAAGSWKKEELLADTKDGYYVVGLKTPGIGETRQNFKITCWKLYRIENGGIGQLYRQGGITSDSPEFFRSIDAAADDFTLFSLPNCGKGTPMQTMRVGNGGPHLRGKAVVSGSHVPQSGGVV